jgi:hypothetical protein
MKNFYFQFISLVFFSVFSVHEGLSQTNNCEEIVFSYDPLGNRIRRELVVVPCDDGPVDNEGGSQARLAQQDTTENNSGDEKASIIAFPNPTADQLFIQSNDRQTITKCMLFDLQGKMILETNPNSNNAMISMSNLASGNYILTVNSHSVKKNFKITKR